MSIADSWLTEFAELGYASGIRVAHEPDVSRYRRLFDEVEAREGRTKCQRGLLDPHFDIPFVLELTTHPAVLDCVEALIGPNILLMGSHFFCKYGPSEAFVAWHQDVTYWGLEPPLAVSAWYAVDDSDAGNGCMQVIPGTHRLGIRAHGKSPAADANLLSINQEVPVSEVEGRQAVNLELKAGEISLHHGMTIHGSQPNRSPRRRCGLAMVYLPTHVRQAGENSRGITWKTVLVRGQNRERNFDAVPLDALHTAAPGKS
jgi:ectoine hydroxylase-related dioxygenase (phytanoyl-CoA dioxygenase family)